MRTLWAIFFLLPVLLLLAGCSKQINSVRPYDQIDLEGIMSSYEGIMQTAISNYELMRGMQGELHNLSEFRGNTVTTSSRDVNTADAYMYGQNAASTMNLAFWRDSYHLIVSCNLTLEGIASFNAKGYAAELDSATRLKLVHAEGEMLFLRGFTYFNLVRLYGRPYYQDPDGNLGVMIKNTSDETYIPGRSSVRAVYDQIVRDLTDAANLMRDVDLGLNSQASYWAAEALLSRVYLYMGGSFENPVSYYNEQAIAYADTVQLSGKYQLVGGYAHDTMYYNEKNNEEMVFTITNQDDFPTNSAAGFYQVLNSGGDLSPGAYLVSSSLWKSFDDDDLRLHYLEVLNGSQVNTKYSLMTVYQNGTSLNPFPFIRYAEVFLNRAEAYLKEGNAEFCLRDLNLVRVRSGLTQVKGISGTQLQDSLMAERRRELCFEGHNSFDDYRNGLPMIRASGDFTNETFVIYPTDKRVVLPIPQSELNTNKNLVQNP